MRKGAFLTRQEKSTGEEDTLREHDASARVIDNDQIIRIAFDESTSKGFEMLFRLYYQALYSHALRFVYSKEKAEDIVCDVFHDFWKSDSYSSIQTTYRTYLYAAVRNRAYSYVRYELKEERNMTGPESSEHISVENSPESIMEYDELHQRIDRAILELPPQCQRVFLLSRFEGKKNKEIAANLDLSIKTVEAHLARALSQLRKVISGTLVLFSWLSQ